MKNYKHYISLGYFCSVALELERLGLRDTSSPFDWLISDFLGVKEAIEHNFEHFFDYEYFEQNKKVLEWYRNSYYSFQFYHDFDSHRSLKAQFSEFYEKYSRRIKRFYQIIVEPTLFLRYISDEKCDANGKPLELIQIESNYEQFLQILKGFNKDNTVIFIANEGVNSSLIKIYHVKKDTDDSVARVFVDKNDELKQLLENAEYFKRENNLNWSKNKHQKVSHSKNAIISCIKHFGIHYHHKRQYLD